MPVTDPTDPFADVVYQSNVVPFRDDVPAWMDEPPPYGEASKPAPPLALIDPATWSGTAAPERRWAIDKLIPHGQATLLTGAGAAGKSLTMQLMMTCVAAGLPFLGVAVEQRNTLYITCEDDAEELHRRQEAICKGLGITMESLSGKLHLLSLCGEIGNELATFDQAGRMAIAPRYHQILAACEAAGVGNLTLDNTAHFFSGNENDRHQVGSFIGLTNRLAMAIDGSVTIVGHPNKAGDSYSGSTAWENQVRSRLFLETPRNEDGSVPDADMRVLRNEKANYARRGSELAFMWCAGTFVLPGDLPEDLRASSASISLANTENEAFLRCLSKATASKRAVSHINGINYAPTIFSRMPEARGIKMEGFRGAMERLLSLGKIALDQPLWKGPNRVMKQGIVATGVCTNPPQETAENRARTPAHTPCTDLHEPPSQVIENIAPTLHAPTPLPLKGEAGAPLDGEPPSWMDEAPPWDDPSIPSEPDDPNWNPIFGKRP